MLKEITMRKKILGATFMVTMIATGYNVHLSPTKNSLSEITLENIEALAQSNNTGEGVESCDIFKFNRNYMEKYEVCTVKYSADMNLLFAEYNGKRFTLGAGAKVGGAVGIPICAESLGNCCLKAFIDNPVKYY